VKQGRLTQAQADRLKQRIQKAGAPAPVPFGAPGAPRVGGPGPLPLGPGFGHPHFGGHRILRAGIAAAAKYLGLTHAQLRKQLESGKSLADIAKAQNKTTSGLEQALTAAVKTRLDKAVANKRITSAQEQQILSRASAEIKDLISATPPPRGKLPRMGHLGFGYHAFGGRFAPRGNPTPPPGAKGGPAAYPTAPPPAGPVA
jgi:transposase-like protein